MRWLLIAVPISIVMSLMHAAPLWIFLVSGLAIVPLAGLLSTATEEYAKCKGPAIGGLLNASFGNATELIICFIALFKGETEIVKASLIGSILGNILLVLGLSILVGGVRFKIQKFNVDVAQSHATMLALAVISLLVPALAVRSIHTPVALPPENIEYLSIGVAVVQIVIYVGGLLFALYTHEQLFRSSDEEENEPPKWSSGRAILVLLLATIAIAYESELLVGSLESVVHTLHLSKSFMGIIVIPIIGNAAEHSTAVMMALRNKMDISLNIAVSSSTQIAMFVAPLLIFVGLFVGHPITILFTNLELVSVSVAVLIAVLISLDGKSHWLEGAQLLAVYVIIGLAFFFTEF